MKRLLFSTVVILLLGACSARQCTLEGRYLESQEVGQLVNPGNGELPERDPAYDIPPTAKSELSATRSYIDAQGQERKDCLDKPPRLISSSAP